MELTPQILFGRVMHRRLFPKVNAFVYGIYYIAVPLSRLDRLKLPVDRFGLLAFYRRDHGARDGSDLLAWLRPHLAAHDLPVDGEVMLVTMPRVLGYVFNPVSFWFCLDASQTLRAVLCEVNNTFGETHLYLCAHADRRAIGPEDVLQGEKFFHVSPFLPREGSYRFRFNWTDDAFGVRIDHDAADGRLQLATALTGRLEPMTPHALRRAFWRYPLVTVKTVALIHWQALKLLAKGVRYIARPAQRTEKVTTAFVKKM